MNERGFALSDFYVNGLTNTSYIPSIHDVTLSADVNNTCLGVVEISEMGFHYLFKITENLKGCNGVSEVLLQK